MVRLASLIDVRSYPAISATTFLTVLDPPCMFHLCIALLASTTMSAPLSWIRNLGCTRRQHNSASGAQCFSKETIGRIKELSIDVGQNIAAYSRFPNTNAELLEKLRDLKSIVGELNVAETEAIVAISIREAAQAKYKEQFGDTGKIRLWKQRIDVMTRQEEDNSNNVVDNATEEEVAATAIRRESAFMFFRDLGDTRLNLPPLHQIERRRADWSDFQPIASRRVIITGRALKITGQNTPLLDLAGLSPEDPMMFMKFQVKRLHSEMKLEQVTSVELRKALLRDLKDIMTSKAVTDGSLFFKDIASLASKSLNTRSGSVTFPENAEAGSVLQKSQAAVAGLNGALDMFLTETWNRIVNEAVPRVTPEEVAQIYLDAYKENQENRAAGLSQGLKESFTKGLKGRINRMLKQGKESGLQLEEVYNFMVMLQRLSDLDEAAALDLVSPADRQKLPFSKVAGWLKSSPQGDLNLSRRNPYEYAYFLRFVKENANLNSFLLNDMVLVRPTKFQPSKPNLASTAETGSESVSGSSTDATVTGVYADRSSVV